MQILSFYQTFGSNKKSRLISVSLLFLLFITSCAADHSQYGRVTLHGPSNKNAFTFFVSEDYLLANQTSKKDEAHPKMSKAESGLLLELLKQNKYCVNSDKKIFFKITSRQEKIYDMTFAHLIEQNYNARPVTPRMYYGECLNKPITQREVVKQIIDETKFVIKE